MPIVQKSIDSLGYQPVDERLIAEDIQALIEEVNILSEGGGGSDYTETIVNISSAQILDMGSTPIELLPAAGVGKYYDIDRVIIEYTHNTTSYTLNSETPCIKDGQNYGAETFSAGMFNEGSNTYTVLDGDLITNVNADPNGKVVKYYNIENNNIVLTTFGGGDFTNGNGTLRVKIYHKTITFGA
jgi:hypothetical protein